MLDEAVRHSHGRCFCTEVDPFAGGKRLDTDRRLSSSIRKRMCGDHFTSTVQVLLAVRVGVRIRQAGREVEKDARRVLNVDHGGEADAQRPSTQSEDRSFVVAPGADASCERCKRSVVEGWG